MPGPRVMLRSLLGRLGAPYQARQFLTRTFGGDLGRHFGQFVKASAFGRRWTLAHMVSFVDGLGPWQGKKGRVAGERCAGPGPGSVAQGVDAGNFFGPGPERCFGAIASGWAPRAEPIAEAEL